MAILLGMALIASGVAYFVSSTSTGTLAVELRDTPVAWSQVVVSFSSLSVRPASAANGTGWVTMPLRADRVELLSLGNLSQLLAMGRMAPGGYAEVRVLISAVSGILSSGAAVVMSVSGGTLDAAVRFVVCGGLTTRVTLDLDLAQSISQTASGWTFTPVLGLTEVT